MMRFYQENQVNPLSSCLPLVAQFPVFIALFYMLQKDLRVEICGQSAKPCGEVAGSVGEAFLFIPDLTDKATGGVLVALIILYVGSQVVSTLFMSVTADKTQRRIFLALPLIFVFFIINFPAGLLVYWITTNLWTIGQGFIVRRQAPPVPAPAAAGGGSSGGLLGGLLGGGAAKAAADSGSSGGANGDGASAKPKAKPPPPPRKKKKQRSGRRR
jgi:YidC/Oxa1 family membrane protein insertase